MCRKEKEESEVWVDVFAFSLLTVRETVFFYKNNKNSNTTIKTSRCTVTWIRCVPLCDASCPRTADSWTHMCRIRAMCAFHGGVSFWFVGRGFSTCRCEYEASYARLRAQSIPRLSMFVQSSSWHVRSRLGRKSTCNVPVPKKVTQQCRSTGRRLRPSHRRHPPCQPACAQEGKNKWRQISNFRRQGVLPWRLRFECQNGYDTCMFAGRLCVMWHGG